MLLGIKHHNFHQLHPKLAERVKFNLLPWQRPVAHRLDEAFEAGARGQAWSVWPHHHRFFMRVAARVHALHRLGPEPQRQVAAVARKRHGDHAACHIGKRDCGRIVEHQRIGGVLRRGGKGASALVQPTAQGRQLRWIGGGASHAPVSAHVQGRPPRLHAIEQRRHVGAKGRDASFARGNGQQLLMNPFEFEPVGSVFLVFGGIVLNRHHLRQKFARRPHLVRQILWRRRIGARYETPQMLATPDRQRERGRDAHVAIILGTHLRHAAQRAVRHVERLVGIRVCQWHHFRQSVGHVGNRPQPGFGEQLAGWLGNVLRRIMQTHPGVEVGPFTFGKHLAMLVRMEFVHHYPVHARQLANFLRCHLAQLQQGIGRLQALHGLPDHAVRVRTDGVQAAGRLKLEYDDAIDRVGGDVERIGHARGGA